jgi:hypothetical protein
LPKAGDGTPRASASSSTALDHRRQVAAHALPLLANAADTRAT